MKSRDSTLGVYVHPREVSILCPRIISRADGTCNSPENHARVSLSIYVAPSIAARVHANCRIYYGARDGYAYEDSEVSRTDTHPVDCTVYVLGILDISPFPLHFFAPYPRRRLLNFTPLLFAAVSTNRLLPSFSRNKKHRKHRGASKTPGT